MKLTFHHITPKQLKFVEDFNKISNENDLKTVELIALMSMILGQIIGSIAIEDKFVQFAIVDIVQRNVDEGIKESLLNRAQPRGNA